MRRLTIFFMLICLSAALSNNTMFMLSIERGKVYTENFSLNHIMRATSSHHSNKNQEFSIGVNSSRTCCHNHIKLSVYTIPEIKFLVAGPESSHATGGFLPAYPAVSNLLAATLVQKQLLHTDLSNMPIAPLLQSSVLLI